MVLVYKVFLKVRVGRQKTLLIEQTTIVKKVVIILRQVFPRVVFWRLKTLQNLAFILFETPTRLQQELF